MIYTINNVMTVVKVLPRGVVTTYESVDAGKVHTEIRNGATTIVYNGAAVFVNSTLTEDGSITISNVPVVVGLNAITIKYANASDFDTATSITTIGSTLVNRVISVTTISI